MIGQELMGLAYFMLDQSSQDAEYCMENAFTTYVVMINLPSFSPPTFPSLSMVSVAHLKFVITRIFPVKHSLYGVHEK